MHTDYAFQDRYCTVTLKEGEDINGAYIFTGWVTDCDHEKFILIIESAINPGESHGEILIGKEQLETGGIAILEIQKPVPNNINKTNTMETKSAAPSLPTTWEEVCKIKNLDPLQSLPYPEPKTAKQEVHNSLHILMEAIEVINDDEQFPDYDNMSEKYEPIFDLSGAGFSYYDYDDAYTDTYAGSRLAYKTIPGLKHGVKHFLCHYEKMLKK